MCLKKNLIALILSSMSSSFVLAAEPLPPTTSNPSNTISIRTESFARPPYSGATFYYYEKNGVIICTKVETCSKFDNCSTDYYKGHFKDSQDVDSEPYEQTKTVDIQPRKLKKHVCLKKYKLN